MPVQGGFSQLLNSDSHPAKIKLSSKMRISILFTNRPLDWRLSTVGFGVFWGSLAFFSLQLGRLLEWAGSSLSMWLLLIYMSIGWTMETQNKNQANSHLPPINHTTASLKPCLFYLIITLTVHLSMASQPLSPKEKPKPEGGGGNSSSAEYNVRKCEVNIPHQSKMNVPTRAQRMGSYFIYFPLFELACTLVTTFSKHQWGAFSS